MMEKKVRLLQNQMDTSKKKNKNKTKQNKNKKCAAALRYIF